MEKPKVTKPKAKKPEPLPEYRFSCYECGTYFNSTTRGYTRCATCGGDAIQVSEKPEGIPRKPADIRLQNLKPPFENGNPGGPGRPPGVRSARDIYSKIGDAVTPKVILDKLAESGIKPTQKELDDVIAYATAVRAAAGNNGALKEYNDRRFGKAEQTIHANVF